MQRLQELGRMHTAVRHGMMSFGPVSTFDKDGESYPILSTPSHDGRLLISQHTDTICLNGMAAAQAEHSHFVGPPIWSSPGHARYHADVNELNNHPFVWSGDDEWIAMVTTSHTSRGQPKIPIVHLLDTTCMELQRLCTTDDRRCRVTFSSCSKLLAVAVGDWRSIKIFRCTTDGMQNLRMPTVLQAEPSLSSSSTRSWQMIAHIPRNTFAHRPRRVYFSPNSQFVAVACWHGAQVFSVNGAPTSEFFKVEPQVCDAAWSSDGTLLFIGQPGDPAVVYAYETQYWTRHSRHTASLPAYGDIETFMTSPYGLVVSASSGRDDYAIYPKLVLLCRLPCLESDGADIQIAQLESSWCTPAISPDGAFIAMFAHPGRELCVLSMKTGECLMRLAGLELPKLPVSSAHYVREWGALLTWNCSGSAILFNKVSVRVHKSSGTTEHLEHLAIARIQSCPAQPT